MANITGDKIVLGDLFGDKYYFSVPEYQRPYSWQKEHCQQLFEDIYDSDRESEYFLGTVILQEVSEVGTGKKYDIIDGQQRLTTMQILLACLRDNVEDTDFKDKLQRKIYQKEDKVDGHPERVRLLVREKDFFKKYVQEINGTNLCLKQNFDNRNNAIHNIINAIKTFYDEIKNLNQSEIESLIQHISQKCIFIFVTTKNFDDAYRLFTIINDRGLQLRRIDILKTMNLDPIIIKDEKVRKEYAKKWENMEDDLGSNEFEKLISFIRNISIKDKAKEDILKEFNKLIFEKGKLKKGVEFIDYVFEYKNIYQKIILDNDIKLDNNENEFRNLIEILVDFFPSNEWIPAILYYYKRFNVENIYEFLIRLEKKVVADWVIALTPTKRTVNINNILKLIKNSNNTNEILKSEILNYDKKQFIDELNNDIYGKRHDKYILIKLEYLESEKNVFKKYSTISVEHVLPQNPKENSQWLTDFSKEQLDKYTNKICNLVLLSKKKNSSASNYDFKEKKEKYLLGRITDLSRSLKVINEDSWTPEILEKRQKEIIELLSK